MRRSTLVTVVLASLTLPTLAAAQDYATDKGSLLVGGTAGITSSKTEAGNISSDRITDIGVAPRVMLFLARNLALGGEFVVGRTSLGDDAVTRFGIGPAATWYFGQGDRTWYPFIGASARFIHTSGNNELGSDTRDLSINGGLLFLLTRAVGINTELFYRTSHGTFDSTATLEEIDIDTNAFGLAIGISAFVF